MREHISRLYFPASIPRPLHARLWRRLQGYGEASFVPSGGKLRVVRHTFKAAVPAAAGKRLLFFSDLHYSGKIKAIADELVEKIREFSPDLLLCGGDFTNSADHLEELRPLLKRLSDGVPCCLTIPGNWERGKAWLSQTFWHAFFRESGWRYLCNEGVPVGDWGWVYGSDDTALGAPGVLQEPPEQRQNILLVHRPDTAIFLDWGGELKRYPLALCGHTHGGQIRLPLLGAVTAQSYYRNKFDCGLFGRKRNGIRMIVSTGVNHASFPLRFNCRREVVLVEFE